MNNSTLQNAGLVMCSKYAFMPNKLEYCGGKKHQDILKRGSNNFADPFLEQLLKEFQTLYPYLKLIASSNNISDPFDARVVEAYWIGNNLLEKVEMKKLYNHFQCELKLKQKLNPKNFEKLVGKIPQGAIPHHSLHVLNIWMRTGSAAIEHTLETMNKCLISWGKIKKVFENTLEVSSPELIFANNQLTFSEPKLKTITFKMLGKSFIKKPTLNSWITIHWGWACETISENQVSNLKKYTLKSLQLANTF